jgi:hypothetical protein
MKWQVCILIRGLWEELPGDKYPHHLSRKNLSKAMAELYPRGAYRIRRR